MSSARQVGSNKVDNNDLLNFVAVGIERSNEFEEAQANLFQQFKQMFDERTKREEELLKLLEAQNTQIKLLRTEFSDFKQLTTKQLTQKDQQIQDLQKTVLSQDKKVEALEAKMNKQFEEVKETHRTHVHPHSYHVARRLGQSNGQLKCMEDQLWEHTDTPGIREIISRPV